MRPLIEEGYVYAACPPLYKVTRQKGKKEEITYLYTKEELDNTDTTGCNIQRYKGLEKPSPYQLFRLPAGFYFIVKLTRAVLYFICSSRNIGTSRGKHAIYHFTLVITITR